MIDDRAETQWPKWIDPVTGRRSDAAHGFVQPLLHGPDAQTNLHVLTEQKTLRVLFSDTDKTKAIGVEYTPNPEARTAATPGQPTQVGEVSRMMARKLVVLSAGAFGTPMILERSGIGAKEILEKVGVDCLVDLPGVGKAYEDHQLAMALYQVSDEADTLDDFLRGKPEVHVQAAADWTANKGGGMNSTNAIDAGMKLRPTEAEVAEMGEDFQKVCFVYIRV